MIRKKTIKVTVTKSDISNGRHRAVQACPIALAIKRRRKSKEVYVGNYTVELRDQTYKLPHAAQVFIKRFDNEQPVRPFTFKLDTLALT
jgi:hypothetical protein